MKIAGRQRGYPSDEDDRDFEYLNQCIFSEIGSDPYEEPENPEIIVDTSKQAPAESVQGVMDWLMQHGYIWPSKPAHPLRVATAL